MHSLTYEHSRYSKLNCAPDGFDVEVSVDEDGSVVHYVVVAYADPLRLSVERPDHGGGEPGHARPRRRARR